MSESIQGPFGGILIHQAPSQCSHCWRDSYSACKASRASVVIAANWERGAAPRWQCGNALSLAGLICEVDGETYEANGGSGMADES